MKNLLLAVCLFAAFMLNAQTTYQISWAVGSNGAETNLTINVDDTVEWLWDDTQPHTVTSQAGSVEDFDSGILTGINESFSYTFTVEGENPYLCEVHPGSMFGTITVEAVLGLEDKVPPGFKLISNLSTDIVTLIFPADMFRGNFKIHNLLGQQVLDRDYKDIERLSLDVATFQDGVYLLTVKSNDKEFAMRFVKQ